MNLTPNPDPVLQTACLGPAPQVSRRCDACASRVD